MNVVIIAIWKLLIGYFRFTELEFWWDDVQGKIDLNVILADLILLEFDRKSIIFYIHDVDSELTLRMNSTT